MYIRLLDESLRVNVYYDGTDREFEDNICICFRESCPQDEKIFKADETNIYLTPEQANLLALALNSAVARSLASKET
ncbi:MAG TPA: hypothetical protein VF177_04555 [Anaerolineae bacterium]